MRIVDTTQYTLDEDFKLYIDASLDGVVNRPDHIPCAVENVRIYYN